MKNFKFFIPLLLLLVIFSACETENNDDSKTVVDIAVEDSNLSSLVAALERADLVTTLSGDGPFTVLAPTNTAFDVFLSANNFNTVEDVPVALLKQILMNHVISGSMMSGDLSTGYANTLATSDASNSAMSIYINTSSGVRFNGISSVSAADKEASNGVVHVVDAVIGLPTVVTFATADPMFSTLVSALTRSDLTTDFVTTLSTANGTSPAPFTVFAPTNQAFTEVLVELPNVTVLGDIDEPTLKSALEYHVVAGSNVQAAGLSDNMTVATLGGNITANVTGGAKLTDANGRISGIIATDVQANNGVIHAIDKVLLP